MLVNLGVWRNQNGDGIERVKERMKERGGGRGAEGGREGERGAARVATCNAARIASVVETFVSFGWPNLLFRVPCGILFFLEALEFHFVILTDCSPGSPVSATLCHVLRW